MDLVRCKRLNDEDSELPTPTKRLHLNGGDSEVLTPGKRLNDGDSEVLTPANKALIKIMSEVGAIFRQFLSSEGFIEIHPQGWLDAPLCQGGSNDFNIHYFGLPTCFAQLPQLYKQMAICSGLGRVFMSKYIYGDGSSCGFTSLDAEVEIDEGYFEIMDIVERLFITIFDSLSRNCHMDLEIVRREYLFTPLKYLPKTLRLTFQEGVQMLKDAGVEIHSMEELNTEAKRKLGQLVLERYGTEFYILHRFPLSHRPFYTMHCEDDFDYSNSFDVFVRGEEIITGGEHVNEHELLSERAEASGIELKTISAYLDSFKYGGVRPHGGFGAGLNRVVMLFLGMETAQGSAL